MLGVPAGTALSYFTSAPIASVWGWRIAMAVAAAPALLLIPAILLLPEPVRGGLDAGRVVTTAGTGVKSSFVAD